MSQEHDPSFRVHCWAGMGGEDWIVLQTLALLSTHYKVTDHGGKLPKYGNFLAL